MTRDKLKQKELNEIIDSLKEFFKKEIAQNHVHNTEKLVRLKEFNLNPFLDQYKARFLTGKGDAYSIAKALVYARSLGPSINTSFGSQLQSKRQITPTYSSGGRCYMLGLLFKHLLLLPVIFYALANSIIVKYKLVKDASFNPIPWVPA